MAEIIDRNDYDLVRIVTGELAGPTVVVTSEQLPPETDAAVRQELGLPIADKQPIRPPLPRGFVVVPSGHISNNSARQKRR